MYYINLYCTVYTCSCSKQQRPNTAHLPESKSQRQGNADHRFAARQGGEVPFRFASFGSGQLPRGGEHVKFHQTSWGGKSYHLKVVCVILFVSLKRMWPCFLWSVQVFYRKLMEVVTYHFVSILCVLQRSWSRSRWVQTHSQIRLILASGVGSGWSEQGDPAAEQWWGNSVDGTRASGQQVSIRYDFTSEDPLKTWNNENNRAGL